MSTHILLMSAYHLTTEEIGLNRRVSSVGTLHSRSYDFVFVKSINYVRQLEMNDITHQQDP